MDALSILFPFFPTWRQIFIFALGLHSTTFSLGSRFLKGMLAFLESLSIVVFLHLHKVTCIFPRTFCWCFSRFVSLALSLIPYSYSWILVPPHILFRLKLNLAWIIFANLFYYLAYFCYYLWVSLLFVILFIGPTILFLLTFSFNYSTFSKKFSVSTK